MVLEKFVERLLGELLKFTASKIKSQLFFGQCNCYENANIMGKVLSAAPLLMCLKACGQ